MCQYERQPPATVPVITRKAYGGAYCVMALDQGELSQASNLLDRSKQDVPRSE